MDTKSALLSQYRATLQMLRRAIEAADEEIWTDPSYTNAFWHIAFHALFYTDFYLSRDEASFVPWAKHREEYPFLGPLPWPPHRPPIIGEPYSRADLLEYERRILEGLEERVLSDDLDSPSGFWWYPLKRLEFHMNNIRHTQHHAGQLIERIRQKRGIAVGWVGREDPEKT